MNTKITSDGQWKIIEGDLISGWVETEGLAHDKFLIPLACQNIPEVESCVVLDIGANIGTHSVSYSKKIAPLGGTLICFEPGALAFECLAENSKKFESKTLLVNCAVCEVHGGTAEHTCIPSNVGGSIVHGENDVVTTDIYDPHTNEVRTITLDGFLEDSRIDLPIVFCKIDVEGYEMKVLKGGVNTLFRKHRPIILMEMNSFRLQENGSSYVEIYDFLLKENFSWRIVEPEAKGGDLCYNILAWPNAIVSAKNMPAG